jgi:hypothetical protein
MEASSNLGRRPVAGGQLRLGDEETVGEAHWQKSKSARSVVVGESTSIRLSRPALVRSV